MDEEDIKKVAYALYTIARTGGAEPAHLEDWLRGFSSKITAALAAKDAEAEGWKAASEQWESEWKKTTSHPCYAAQARAEKAEAELAELRASRDQALDAANQHAEMRLKAERQLDEARKVVEAAREVAMNAMEYHNQKGWEMATKRALRLDDALAAFDKSQAEEGR